MEGSVGEGRLLVRNVFITGAIRCPTPGDWQRMIGVHDTIVEECTKRGIQTFDAFILKEEVQHPNEIATSDLVIAEETFKEPRLEVEVGTARDLGKPILHLFEERSSVTRLRRQAVDYPWKIEYSRYPVLAKLLDAWLQEFTRLA